MEISNAHHQAMACHSLEEVLGGCPKAQQHQQERKVRPQPEQSLRCPRCDSTNTKFCYYNNYSLSQPRYFCKGCRRYWTQGGTLRNVPVGGGCRKNKRSSSSSSAAKRSQDQGLTTNSNPLLPSLIPPPPLAFDPSDLTLAFASLHNQSTTTQLGLADRFLAGNPNPNPNPSTSSAPTAPSFLEILRSGFVETTTPSDFHDLYYYGLVDNGMVGEVEGCIGGEQVVLPFEGGLVDGSPAATGTGNSQGSCNAMDGGDHENKVLTGLQWQSGGDGNFGLDPGKDYWNGVASSFHGLINSSLM